MAKKNNEAVQEDSKWAVIGGAIVGLPFAWYFAWPLVGFVFGTSSMIAAGITFLFCFLMATGMWSLVIQQHRARKRTAYE